MSTANLALEATDLVVRLRELMAGNALVPGDRLPPIRELAVTFGVKPGAVRDALLTAQAQGLVKILPRVGAIVQSLGDFQGPPSVAAQLGESLTSGIREGDQNLFHILETREALELTMVARAAQRRELAELFRLRQILAEMADITREAESPEYARLDVEYHLEIGRLSGNTVMTSLLRMLLLEVRPHLDCICWSDARRVETNEQHTRIYSALVAGDAEQAQGEMRTHIRAAYDSLLDEMRRPPTMDAVRAEGSSS